jgi:hypothetical protein
MRFGSEGDYKRGYGTIEEEHGRLGTETSEGYCVSHGAKIEQSADMTGTGANLQKESIRFTGPEDLFPRDEVSPIRRLIPEELDQV